MGHDLGGEIAASAEDYSWVTEVLDAACITFVRGQSRAHVLAAFLADPDVEVPLGDAYGVGPDVDGFVSILETGVGVVAVEDNGFQGSLPDVLAAASMGSAVAASMFWNVDEDTAFTCARDGELIATVDMHDADSDEELDLPADLRSLFASAAGDGADRHAIGLAMAEQFVGVGVSRSEVESMRVAHPYRPLA
jgi:hypothetical protein